MKDEQIKTFKRCKKTLKLSLMQREIRLQYFFPRASLDLKFTEKGRNPADFCLSFKCTYWKRKMYLCISTVKNDGIYSNFETFANFDIKDKLYYKVKEKGHLSIISN